MKQEYEGPVGQSIQARTAHIADQSSAANTGNVTGHVAGHDFMLINNFQAEGEEELDDDRKSQLSRRAAALELKYQRPKWKTRTQVNEIVGVISQDVMRAKHYSRATKVYDLLFEIEDLKAQLAERDKVIELRSPDQLNGVIATLKQRVTDLTGELAQVKADVQPLSVRPAKPKGRRRRLPFMLLVACVVLISGGSFYGVRYAHSSATNASVEPLPLTSTDSTPSAADTCQGRTKRYPIGSIVHGTSGKVECVAGDSGKQPKWVPAT